MKWMGLITASCCLLMGVFMLIDGDNLAILYFAMTMLLTKDF